MIWGARGEPFNQLISLEFSNDLRLRGLKMKEKERKEKSEKNGED